MKNYIPLHNHSTYSILDGLPSPEEYLKKCKELEIKSFGITEHGNNFSWLYFAELSKKYDIKINYGIEIYETEDIKIKNKDNKYYHLIIYPINDNGRIALNKLITLSNKEGFFYKPRMSLDMIKPYGKDLLCLTACMGSKIAKEKDYDKCIKYINEYKSIFAHTFLEMQSHDTLEQCEYNKKILQLSNDTLTDYVITTDAHYIEKEDQYYHSRFIQIARDSETMTEDYKDCYFQNNNEIHNIMDSQIGFDNTEIGLKNTFLVDNCIENINQPFKEPELPKFCDNEEEKLWEEIQKGIKFRNINVNKEIEERIKYEYSVLKKYAGYLLIVQDIILWAKNNNIIVGAGRGSAGGSYCLYLMRVVEANPMDYGLYFERFANPNRISFFDIDSDFSDRDSVVKYIYEKYGKEKTCQILNFSYISPKVAIKDACKVLKIPYKIADEISKYFIDDDFENGYKAVEKKYGLDYEDMFNIAKKISGRVRQLGIHACGIIVSKNEMENYLSLVNGKDDNMVVSCDKIMAEKIGLVKIDILGVESLNVINETLKLLNKKYYDIKFTKEFLSDKEVYNFLSTGETKGCFQLESFGIQDVIRKIKPENIIELSDVISIYRPDTMFFIEDYIKNKKNPEKIKYFHEDLKPILEKHNGVMLYQENLMSIVAHYSGKGFARGDVFRKILGKKEIDKIQSECDILNKEIIDNGYSQEISNYIVGHLRECGGYLFNFSHGLLYSYNTYLTAYLKYHYPLQFMTALLNSVTNSPPDIAKYIAECEKMKIKILPPNINKSKSNFSINNNVVLFGFSAIKGIGLKLSEEIVKNQPYTSFTDFISRIKINTDQVVQLIKSGAFGNKKEEFLRKYMFSLMDNSNYERKLVSETTLKKYKLDIIEYNKQKEIEFLLKLREKNKNFQKEFEEKYIGNKELYELETLNMFLTNNPFKDDLVPFDKIEDKTDCILGGAIIDIESKKDKRGKKYAYVKLYTKSGIVECVAWANVYEEYHSFIKKGEMVVILGKKEQGQMFIKKIKNYYEWLEGVKNDIN